ncbi:trans-acting enoyl reductase family protein [Halomicronema sp. CCY15110]|uniref:saccharopine dehydrogenase family protein n=1 Tax=Halomicronema sp. CCY15110 TaxID=2767773 RepID=UPI001951FDFE|nr:saccharopine dehydrogenase NADP-binding domain-containing protein [Halomicronema sp. CCY15110]
MFDVVVFGATGFVGQLVCQALVQQSERESLRWAIAGRSASKLKVLADRLAPGSAAIAQIVADADDDATLRAMCLQTRVVLSTVGPYALYGDRLVKACAETGTHYCDLTGESQWIRRMLDQHQVQAAESGAYIVPCCGFDSIPSDLGVYHLQSQAQQRYQHPCEVVNMRVMAAQGGVSGGTIASGLNLVKEAMDDPDLRRALQNPYFLCPDSQQLDTHSRPLIPVQFDQDFQEWVTPFVMADVNVRVVLRSNYLQNYAYGTDFRYEEGILTRGGPIGWLVAQGLKFGLDGLVLATAIPPLRELLETTLLPKPGEGPSPEAQNQGFYDLRLIGKTADGQVLKTQVKGDRDPGYGSTAKLIAQASICLAKDLKDSSQPGGFWTPASLMGSQLLERLPKWAGVTFTVLN